VRPKPLRYSVPPLPCSCKEASGSLGKPSEADPFIFQFLWWAFEATTYFLSLLPRTISPPLLSYVSRRFPVFESLPRRTVSHPLRIRLAFGFLALRSPSKRALLNPPPPSEPAQSVKSFLTTTCHNFQPVNAGSLFHFLQSWRITSPIVRTSLFASPSRLYARRPSLRTRRPQLSYFLRLSNHFRIRKRFGPREASQTLSSFLRLTHFDPDYLMTPWAFPL